MRDFHFAMGETAAVQWTKKKLEKELLWGARSCLGAAQYERLSGFASTFAAWRLAAFALVWSGTAEELLQSMVSSYYFCFVIGAAVQQ